MADTLDELQRNLKRLASNIANKNNERQGYLNQADEIQRVYNRLLQDKKTIKGFRKDINSFCNKSYSDPYRIAEELGINILYRDFKKQRGAYKVILKNRFIFLQNGLHPVIEQIVLWHEIGHDMLHRQEASLNGGFQEFNIFDMRENRMEYEANVFAAQASLPDDTIIEYIKDGYDIQQIAKAMHSDINLIALKVDTLNSQGYQFRKQEHRNDFLKYNKQI